jgi:hypothetical protein
LKTLEIEIPNTGLLVFEFEKYSESEAPSLKKEGIEFVTFLNLRLIKGKNITNKDLKKLNSIKNAEVVLNEKRFYFYDDAGNRKVFCKYSSYNIK